MAAKRGNLTFYPNIRPGVGWKIFPGLKAYFSLGLKGPKFSISGDPKKILKALDIGSEEKDEKEEKE